ncbi:MAG: EsaB/YukD family protein [Burkholderiales bacterium]
MEHVAEEKKPAEKPDHSVTVVISTADEDREFTFPKTTKISEVISTVLDVFGLDPKDVYSLALADKPKEKLAADRPLVSYKIEDGTKLVLSSKGGGV